MNCDFKGEGVGFLKLAANDCHKLKTILEEFEQAGKVNVEYEDSLHELLSHCTIGFERVEDLPWIEIDFEEDIERAGREILPRLENANRRRKKIDQPSASYSDSPIIDRYIIRKISGFISGFLIRTPVTPNQVTIISLILGIISGVFFSLGEYTYTITAG